MIHYRVQPAGSVLTSCVKPTYCGCRQVMLCQFQVMTFRALQNFVKSLAGVSVS